MRNDPRPPDDPEDLPAALADDLTVIPAEEGDEADGVEHFQFKPSKNITRRIDQYLKDRLPYLSRNAVQRLMDEGLVKVNGKVAKASYRPKDGDVIDMVAPPKPVSELIPEPIPLDVIHEDDHFMAINKQANLLVHPARGKWTGTLVNALVHYGQKWSTVNGNWRPGILHRLDRNTTGVMLIAKSDEAHWRLARQFETRTIQKTYVCVAHGVPELLSDVIDLPIGKDRYVRERQAIRKEENGGRPAVTTYQVLETFDGPVMGGAESSVTLHASSFPKDKGFARPPGRFSFIKMFPRTGRTHQLRVHLMARGHPMVGDTMYGGRIFEAGDFRLERQALHACEITFTHPGTLEPMTLQAPLPPDMLRLLKILRGH